MRQNTAIYKIWKGKKKLHVVVIRLNYANPEWKQSADGEADM